MIAGFVVGTRRGGAMRKSGLAIVAALVVTSGVALAGCGGSDAPEAVNGCTIEAGTTCPGADLSGEDLSGVDLSGADLSKAKLDGTNLSDSNLSEANLSAAQITNADLSNADLTRANLSGATIDGTSLDGATLCGTTRTDGTTDDSSCPASTDSSSTESTQTTTETTTTTEGAEATVTSFAVGKLVCTGSSGDLAVTWTTGQATAVKIEVDGSDKANEGPSGSTTVSIPCDGASHQVTVLAENDSGEGQAKSATVTGS
jgi:hypothetical protein